MSICKRLTVRLRRLRHPVSLLCPVALVLVLGLITGGVLYWVIGLGTGVPAFFTLVFSVALTWTRILFQFPIITRELSYRSPVDQQLALPDYQIQVPGIVFTHL
jgi:hypothetical protein